MTGEAAAATDARAAALVRLSLALWRVPATVTPGADGKLCIALETGETVTVGRAPAGIPFRWLVRTPAGRERPASSVVGLLRILRATLDPEWRPGRARVMAITPPAAPR